LIPDCYPTKKTGAPQRSNPALC